MSGAGDVRVVPYSERHAAGQRALAERMWPTKLRRREERYIRWKFRGPESGEVPGLLLAVEDDAVLGQLGLLPVRLRVGGDVLPAQWACDLMVDDRARLRRVGTILLRAGMDRDAVTLGSEPSPAADVAMARVGFRPIRGPRKMALPLDVTHVIGWKVRGAGRPLVRPLAALARPAVALLHRRLTGRRPRAEARACHWREVVPRVVAREAALDRPHVVHDEEFLSWRCPGLAGFSRELSALAVGNGGYAIWEATVENFYVHDWHADSPDAAAAIFQALLVEARRAGSRTIRAMAQGPRELAWLRQLGLLAQRRPVHLIHWPEAPLAGRGEFLYCIYDADGNL